MVNENFVETYLSIQQEVKCDLEIEYVYHTNRLEGSKLPKYATIKVLTAAKGVYRPQRFRYKDIIAAYNHPRAIRYIRKLASIPDYKITEAYIRRIHSTISEHLITNPGQYRDHDVAISGSKFIPPSYQDVREEMEGLVNFMNNKGTLDAIEHASRVHFRLARIHPFSDFNGRVARLLTKRLTIISREKFLWYTYLSVNSCWDKINLGR